jgi:hypothetical protein
MKLAMLIAVFGALTVSAQNTLPKTNFVSGLAITNIIAHKQEFQGKRVEVKGYYWTGPESSQVSDGLERGPIESSLWVAYYRVKPGCEEKVKWSKKGLVRIVGRLNFLSGYPGPWPGEITDLEVFEISEDRLNQHLQATPR